MKASLSNSAAMPPGLASEPDWQAAPQPAQPPADLTAPHALSSQQLMQGRKTVTISHNGTEYRLQATRQGKLILTK